MLETAVAFLLGLYGPSQIRRKYRRSLSFRACRLQLLRRKPKREHCWKEPEDSHKKCRELDHSKPVAFANEPSELQCDVHKWTRPELYLRNGAAHSLHRHRPVMFLERTVNRIHCSCHEGQAKGYFFIDLEQLSMILPEENPSPLIQLAYYKMWVPHNKNLAVGVC